MLKELTEIFVLIGLFITDIIYKILGIEEEDENGRENRET